MKWSVSSIASSTPRNFLPSTHPIRFGKTGHVMLIDSRGHRVELSHSARPAFGYQTRRSFPK